MPEDMWRGCDHRVVVSIGQLLNSWGDVIHRITTLVRRTKTHEGETA